MSMAEGLADVMDRVGTSRAAWYRLRDALAEVEDQHGRYPPRAFRASFDPPPPLDPRHNGSIRGITLREETPK